MSLQDALDKNYVEGRKDNLLPRAVIRNDSGSLHVPKHVSVDLIDCSIDSLTTDGDNRINIERGTLNNAQFTDTALIARDCTGKGAISASGSKLEFNRAILTSEITLTNASNLVSNQSTYNGSQAFNASGGAKVVSWQDKFTGSGVVIASGGWTNIRLVDATIQVGGKVFDLSSGAECMIEGGTIQANSLGDASNAKAEIRTCSEINVNGYLVTATKNSQIALKKLQKLQTGGSAFIFDSSSLEVVDVATIQIGQTFLKLTSSRADIIRFQTLQCQTLCEATGNNLVRIAHGTTITANKLGSADTGTRITLDAIQTIKTQAAMSMVGASVDIVDVQTFNGQTQFGLTNSSILSLTRVGTTTFTGKFAQIENSSVLFSKCSTINGQALFITGTGQGVVQLDGSTTVTTDKGFLDTIGVYTATLSNNATITSTTAPVVHMASQLSSVLTIQSCQNITANDTVVDMAGVDCSITASTLTSSTNSAHCVKGRPGGGISQLQTSKCNISSFDMQEYSCSIFATVFSKYIFNNCDVDMRRCIQQGVQTTEESLFTQSALLDRMSEWFGKIHSRQSTLQHLRSKVHDTWISQDSVIRADCATNMSGAVGFVPENGGTRGNAVFAAGWDMQTIQGDTNNKDSFSLYNLTATPTYTNHGALFLMNGEPCDKDLLNFIRINWDNIRILDSRNTYMDVTNNHVRHATGFIQDDAGPLLPAGPTGIDGWYYLHASQQVLEKADVQFTIITPRLDTEKP
jgi:hypothetical protein